MKELNRKGFTLVELLAVIVILAIVIGITIPAVTRTINNSKNNSLKVILDSAENWLAEQYSLYNVSGNDETVVSKSFLDNLANIETAGGTTIASTTTANNLLVDAGIAAKNFTSAKVYLNPDTGKACVVMAVIPDTSQYYNTKIWTKGTDNTATPKTDSNGKLVGAEFIFSKSCTDITDITKAAA